MSHIAFVLPGFPGLGGAERQVLALAHGLLARGWRVSVVALSLDGGEPARELTAAGASFVTLEMKKGLADPSGWLRFHRWLLAEAPDVVHAHLPHAAWFCRWSRLAAPVPVLVDTIHTSATGTLGRRLGYRLSRRLPDRVTVVSRAAAHAWLNAGMVSPDRLLLLPNGVDTHRFRPKPALRDKLRAELGLADEFLFVAAGRLAPVKDFSTLLWALSQLPENPHLALAGAGPLDAELHTLAHHLGLDKRVHFLGLVPKLERTLQAADGFVLSSLWEGLPMALLEASACALPAVSTPVAGAAEIVEEGKTGFLAATTGSALALEGRMAALMRLPAEKRAAMGKAARQKILHEFSLERVLDRWEALYGELLAQNTKPRRWGAPIRKRPAAPQQPAP